MSENKTLLSTPKKLVAHIGIPARKTKLKSKDVQNEIEKIEFKKSGRSEISGKKRIRLVLNPMLAINTTKLAAEKNAEAMPMSFVATNLAEIDQNTTPAIAGIIFTPSRYPALI